MAIVGVLHFLCSCARTHFFVTSSSNGHIRRPCTRGGKLHLILAHATHIICLRKEADDTSALNTSCLRTKSLVRRIHSLATDAVPEEVSSDHSGGTIQDQQPLRHKNLEERMQSDGVAPDEVPSHQNIRPVDDRDTASGSTREKVQSAPRIKHEMDDSMLVADTASSTREDVPPVPRIKRERDDSVFEQAPVEGTIEVSDNEEEDNESEDVEAIIDDGDYGSENDEEEEEFEPDYRRANKIRFADLCGTFEKLWENRKRTTNRGSRDQQLRYILPKALLDTLQGGSPFPILRLIMPEIDTSRPHFGMRESNIVNAWKDALGWTPKNKAYLKLKNYTDPASNPTAAGDLSIAVEEVAQECGYCTPSKKIKIGEVNELLDELANMKKGISRQFQSQEWRTADSREKPSGGMTVAKQRAEWVQKLLTKLTPSEHKWIVRILLQKVEVGVGYKSILKYYSPFAEELYNANNSLKRLCTTLSNPVWIEGRKERARQEGLEMAEDSRRNHLPRCHAAASLGNMISPMLAQRTSFESAMSDITTRHSNFASELTKKDTGANSLALKFPTFICEVKLDGERILAHVNRGVVKMQTRNSKWYSKLYSPVLGPTIRRAIAHYDVDVILDGEVVSWDNERQETIPFGINRTVAIQRGLWLKRHGLLDKRDLNLHEGEEDVNVMRASADKPTKPADEPEAGADCWLKFIVFDILYVGGPDAAKLISEATALDGDIPTGSILNLDGFERKKILYRLIDQQANEVEIVPSLVIRSNGRSENAATYFSPSNPPMEAGYPYSMIDSIECALRGDMPNQDEIDAKSRESKSDLEISNRRVAAMNQFYVDIVENQALEGLVFKDLAAPYFLGPESRNLRYWNKLKPDYNSSGEASDIDAVVLGAFYGTGMKYSGMLNHFLLGCVDPSNPGTFMTLCKISGGGTARMKLESLLKKTGYQAGTDEKDLDPGKWFKEQEHGKSLPDFISKRSFQQGSDGRGWKFHKKQYPDFWIHPDNSVVLTVNAGEITISDDFSAGVTLRFPRIDKVRIEDADGGVKPADECETVDALHQLYRQIAQRKEGSGAIDFEFGSPSRPNSQVMNTRFLTVDEQTKRKKSKGRQKATSAGQPSQMPTVDKKESAALDGLIFWVLDGRYSLDEGTLDAEQAKEEGWLEEARKVKERRDVQEFILKHGGTCKFGFSTDLNFMVGGRVDDPRVKTLKSSLDRASKVGKLTLSKKDMETKKLLELGGFLKWTSVISMVRRWINEVGSLKVEEGVVETPGTALKPRTQLLRPCRHDYLVLGESAQFDDGGEVFGIPIERDITMLDFRRGLEEVQRHKRSEPQDQPASSKRARFQGQLTKGCDGKGWLVPWQYAAVQSLPPAERWVLAGDFDKLWVYGSQDTADSPPTVLYPDIFDNDYGLHKNQDALQEALSGTPSSRWDNVSHAAQMGTLSSSLPLARVMGAQVTPHLHDGVTHIICHLRGYDKVSWKPHSFQSDPFKCQERALSLHRRLLDLHRESTDEPVIVDFVSPNWIRKKFDGSDAS